MDAHVGNDHLSITVPDEYSGQVNASSSSHRVTLTGEASIEAYSRILEATRYWIQEVSAIFY